MRNTASIQGSSSVSAILFRTSRSVTTGPRSLFSQLMMVITVFALLVGFLPHVSCSPTPLSNAMETNNNNKDKIIYDSNAFMFDPTDYHPASRQDSSSLISSVQEQPFSGSSS